MKKTWKVRVHKFVDGKWDNTIEIPVKNKRRGREVLFEEYLNVGDKLAEYFNIDYNLTMFESDFVDILDPENDNHFTVIAKNDDLKLKKIKYEGEVVKD